jgi:hypothetical protein
MTPLPPSPGGGGQEGILGNIVPGGNVTRLKIKRRIFERKKRKNKK